MKSSRGCKTMDGLKGNVAVFESEEELKKAYGLLEGQGLGAKKALFVFLGRQPPEFALKKGLRTRVLESYLSGKEKAECEQWAFDIAETWHSFDRRAGKMLQSHGIALPSLINAWVWVRLREACFLLKGLENMAGKEKPGKLLVAENSLAHKALEEVLRKNGSRARIETFGAKQEQRDKPGFHLRQKAGELVSKGFRGLLGQIFKKRPDPGKKTVFVRSRGHLGLVSTALEKRPWCHLVSLDEFLAARAFNPFTVLPMRLAFRRNRARLKKVFEILKESKAFRQAMVFQDLDVFAVAQNSFRSFLLSGLPQFEVSLGLLEKKFERERPSLVVVWTDNVGFEKILVLLAKKFKIPSLVVQHGLVTEGSMVKNWIKGLLPVYADRMASWGPAQKEFFAKRGGDAKKMVVTGPSKFDLLVARKEPDRNFVSRIGCGNRKLVVLASQPKTPEINSHHIAKEAIKAVQGFNNVKLAIKTHPIEKPEEYRRIIKEMGSDAIVMEDSLYELIRASTALITHSSTVGLEAMALGKPAIIFSEKGNGLNLYDSTDSVFRAVDGKGLGKVLEEIFSKGIDKERQEGMEKFVFEMAFRQDGQATERIVGLAEQMALGKARK